MAKKQLPAFDKYQLYSKSVQSPEDDVVFLTETYYKLRGEAPKTFREDFCGTFYLCCEWVKSGDEREAIGIDLDPEPLAYGKNNYLAKLSEEQKKRVTIHQGDVLKLPLPKVDIACALNFSYFIFKDRSKMKQYFKAAFDGLHESGVLVLDIFGGSQCQEQNEEETEHEDEKFSYFWDQDSFDPVTNNAHFYIHFQRKGEKKREKVFSYDWRMWSIPELRDILAEVGFAETYVYWEGTDEDGDGDGVFERTEVGEECESWIAYIVALK